jgi:hypothetical protein
MTWRRTVCCLLVLLACSPQQILTRPGTQQILARPGRRCGRSRRIQCAARQRPRPSRHSAGPASSSPPSLGLGPPARRAPGIRASCPATSRVTGGASARAPRSMRRPASAVAPLRRPRLRPHHSAARACGPCPRTVRPSVRTVRRRSSVATVD